jgi:hypothetical protein
MLAGQTFNSSIKIGKYTVKVEENLKLGFMRHCYSRSFSPGARPDMFGNGRRAKSAPFLFTNIQTTKSGKSILHSPRLLDQLELIS